MLGQITKTTEPEHGLTRFDVNGEVNVEQVLDQLIPFLTETPTPLVIWSIGEGGMKGLSGADLRRIVDVAAPFSASRAGGRTAIVCMDDLDYGLSRMFQTLAELYPIPFEMRVFRDLNEALAWLKAPATH